MSNASGRSFDNGDIFYSDGGDAIEVRIRSYATVVEPQWCGVVGI